MTTTKTRSQLGASNLSKGLAWMHDFARWLRSKGFPGADVIRGTGRADIAGLTEWTIEAKNIGDEYKLPGALDQARRDQLDRGTPWHVVVQKRRGKADPGQGMAIMTIEQWARIAAMLDKEGL